MTYSADIQELADMGMNVARLATHSRDEIRLALCAVQESGNDVELIRLVGDSAAAVVYAESALGW